MASLDINENKEIIVNSIDFIFSEPSCSPSPGKTWFQIYVKINGILLNEKFPDIASFCLMVDEYYRSVNEKYIENTNELPRFYFFTCECGDPGCDGWFKGIKFTIDDDTVTWIFDEKFKEPLKIIFVKNYYIESLIDLISEMRQFIKTHPNTTYHARLNSELKTRIYD